MLFNFYILYYKKISGASVTACADRSEGHKQMFAPGNFVNTPGYRPGYFKGQVTLRNTCQGVNLLHLLQERIVLQRVVALWWLFLAAELYNILPDIIIKGIE